MSKFTPPKGELITFTERDVGFGPEPGEVDTRDGVVVIGAQKFFEDPHQIGFGLASESFPDSRTFMKWTLEEPHPVNMLNALKDVLVQGGFEDGRGSIALTNSEAEHARDLFLPSNVQVNTLIGAGTIHLEGEAVDIAAEVLAHPERVLMYSLSNDQLSIWWNQAWGSKFHDIPSHEITLREIVSGSLSRFVVDQCVSVTAGTELRDSIDQTLDEMSIYIPTLAG